MDIEKLIDLHTLVQAKYDRDLRQALYDQGLTPEQLAEKYKKDAEIGWVLFTKVIQGLRKIKVSKADTYKELELPLLPKNSWNNELAVSFLIYDDARVYCCIGRKGKDYGATGQRNGGDHQTTKREFVKKPFLVEVFSLPNMEKLIADTLNEQEWFLAKTYPLLEKEIEKDKTKPLLLAPPPSPQLRTELIEDPATGEKIQVTWWGDEPPKLGRIIDPTPAVDLYAQLTQARVGANTGTFVEKGAALNPYNPKAHEYLTHILDSAWANAFSSGPTYDKTLVPVDIIEAGVWYEISYKDHSRAVSFYRTFVMLDSHTMCASLTYRGEYHKGKRLEADVRRGDRTMILADDHQFRQIGMKTAEYLTYHFCRLEREGKIKE
jgi:hypothetical protein